MKGAFQMLDGEKQLYSLRKPFIVHLTLLFLTLTLSINYPFNMINPIRKT
jgi:hypothetical protein